MLGDPLAPRPAPSWAGTKSREGAMPTSLALVGPGIPACWTRMVFNPGSVGQPLDRDPRASYIVIENGAAEIRRVAYDVEATITGLRKIGLGEVETEALASIHRTGKPVVAPAGESEGGPR